jgi:hypothetical protein
MEAWLAAHNLKGVARPAWAVPESTEAVGDDAPIATTEVDATSDVTPAREPKRRSTESLRRQLREIIESLGGRDLEVLVTLGDFLRTRRQQRGVDGESGEHAEHGAHDPGETHE